jgi:hypothetical protein
MGAWWLMWVGALNWGLVGALNVNLVNMIFGSWPMVERVVYVLVGLAAIMMLFTGACKMCKVAAGDQKPTGKLQ